MHAFFIFQCWFLVPVYEAGDLVPDEGEGGVGVDPVRQLAARREEDQQT